MDKVEFEQYLIDRYNNQVDWYDKNSVLYKRLNYFVQIPTIIISAIIPIFAATDNKWITVAMSAIVAVLIGMMNFSKFDDKWHIYRSTCETLKREKFYHQSKIGEYDEVEDPEKLFIKRVEAVISSEHSRWLTVEKEQRKKKRE